MPTTVTWLTVDGANYLEKLLVNIEELIGKMVYVFRYTNTFNLGGMEGLI